MLTPSIVRHRLHTTIQNLSIYTSRFTPSQFLKNNKHKTKHLSETTLYTKIMTLKFFTENELEEFYGKPFSQISPTDMPLSKYIVGNETTTCQECGATLEVTCTGTPENTHALDGFTDVAYCSNCEIEYKRNRNLVNENIDYQYSHHRTDEREEYVCSDCHQRHPLTVPEEDFTRPIPSITSYEQVSIPCPCGALISIDTVEFPESINCPNCPRTYNFTVN